MLTLSLPVLWAFLLWFLPWAEIGPESRAIFLFLGVFPLINALLDVVSYAITLTLLKRGLNSGHPFFLGFLDLIAALILFMSLGLILTATITIMNAISGTDLINMTALFNGIRENPSDYIWLYIMMFSTILPTAIHFLIAILSVTSFIFPFIRHPVARLIDQSPNDALCGAIDPIALGALITLPFFAVLWLCTFAAPFIIPISQKIGWAVYGVQYHFYLWIAAF